MLRWRGAQKELLVAHPVVAPRPPARDAVTSNVATVSLVLVVGTSKIAGKIASNSVVLRLPAVHRAHQQGKDRVRTEGT